MLDIFAGFDILGLGALLGSLLFLAGLVWLLVDNRSFDDVNRRHAAEVERTLPVPAPRHANVATAAPTRTAEAAERRARTPAERDATSGGPTHPGRVA